MGMSATQARYLSLIAQQSNLEYQGQQINQERSVLSQQVSDLYNTLLNLEVPTPPKTNEFTKVVYTATTGATTYNFEPSQVRPGADGKYTIIMNHTEYGNALDQNKGYAVTSATGAAVKGNMIAYTGSIKKDAFDSLYLINPQDNTLTKLELDKEYINGDPTSAGPFTLNDKYKNWQLFMASPDEGQSERHEASTNPSETNWKIAGKNAYTLAEAKDNGLISPETYNGYVEAINNSNIRPAGENSEPYKPEDFFIYFDDENTAHFALITDVTEGNDTAVTYDCIPNVPIVKNEPFTDCILTFDPSTGRIATIDLPTKNPDGTIASYTTINLSASTVTDEAAYDDAMVQYKYKQYLYDQEQTEIDARTEKIQAMDRNLELKLQRLDTQRQQITTEVESLKNVLKNNIEGSYKTFSG